MSIVDEFEAEAFGELAELFMPKMQKFIKPMEKKLKEFLKENNKCLHLILEEDEEDESKDELYFMIIDKEVIEDKVYDLISDEDTKDKVKVVPLNKFADLLATGKLEVFMSTMESGAKELSSSEEEKLLGQDNN